MAKGYTSINLPTDLVGELKLWQKAFSLSYEKNITYGEMIRSMLDSLEETEPGVVAEMDAMIERHPELLDKMTGSRATK